MNFEVKTIKEKVVEAITDKGFTLRYSQIPMDKIKCHIPELFDKGVADDEFENVPTVIDIDCNFRVIPQMCDRLNQSKIIIVTQFWSEEESSKYESKIRFEILRLFSYEKLNDILYDMCVAFDLQTKLPEEKE